MAQNTAQAADQGMPESVKNLLQCATYAPVCMLAYNSRALYYINHHARNAVTFDYLAAMVRINQENLQVLLNKLEIMKAVKSGVIRRVGHPDVEFYCPTELSRWMEKEEVQAKLREKIKDAEYITRVAAALGQPYGDFAEELAKAEAKEA